MWILGVYIGLPEKIPTNFAVLSKVLKPRCTVGFRELNTWKVAREGMCKFQTYLRISMGKH